MIKVVYIPCKGTPQVIQIDCKHHNLFESYNKISSYCNGSGELKPTMMDDIFIMYDDSFGSVIKDTEFELYRNINAEKLTEHKEYSNCVLCKYHNEFSTDIDDYVEVFDSLTDDEINNVFRLMGINNEI